MRLAVRNLRYEPLRALLSIVGIALAVMLVVLLGGLQDGLNRQISAYPDHAPGSVVIAQDGVANLLGATSSLPAGTDSAATVAAPGARIVPILSQFIVLELHGAKQPVYLVGYEPERGGGPWRLAAGSEPEADDEIVLDRVLAGRHGIRLGDQIDLMGLPVRVSGLSDETSSWMTSFVFVRKTAAERLLQTPGVTSFLFVTPPPKQTADALAAQLGRLPGTDVLAKEEMIRNDIRLYEDVFSPPIRLMTSIALLIGTLVVGLVIYTATVERRREYGVLKALGAPRSLLYRVVGAQALAVACLGSMLGLGLTVVVARLIMELRPQFLVVLAPGSVAIALASGVLMALVAALFPARVLARLAPADVFRK